MSRSCRPKTISSGAVIFSATPSSESVCAIVRASSSLPARERTWKVRRVSSGSRGQQSPKS
jgi:hypothetical protein